MQNEVSRKPQLESNTNNWCGQDPVLNSNIGWQST